jgi:4-amino-4-deoxychorismate lyase
MYKFVSFNQQIIPSDNALLPAISSVTFYGKGVFTTVAIYNSKPFQFEKHLQRLEDNAEKIGVELSEFPAKTIENSLYEIIEKNKLTNARVRLTFFDESSNKIWQSESKRRTSFLIICADFRFASANFRLAVSPHQINSKSPLVNIKSCNYLENLLALEDVKRKGFDEAIRLNERAEIVSASMANVFWIKNNQIFTPNLQTGCLNGTTRYFVLENFQVKEIEANLAELENADEIFLTSAGIGVAKVKVFGEKILADEITNSVKDEFLRHCSSY